MVYSCEIPRKCKIGGGTKFLHNAKGVVLNKNASIGNNCLILHNVTIGCLSPDDHPRIGNNVLIGTGTIILGDVTIGDNCKIGAGSLVMDSLPANTVFYDKRDPVIKKI